jgi:hypothetical protein
MRRFRVEISTLSGKTIQMGWLDIYLAVLAVALIVLLVVKFKG